MTPTPKKNATVLPRRTVNADTATSTCLGRWQIMEISGAGTEDRARHGGVFDSVHDHRNGSDFIPETILEDFVRGA
jgi:hypothetical protein